MSYFLTVNNLTFTYKSAIEPLFESISFQLDRGWTGLIGPNGCGKTTLLRLICGQLTPDSGSITSVYCPIYCEQRTDTAPSLHVSDRLINKYMAKLSCHLNWLQRWKSLSHGERKRCQLAIALAQEPDILAVDEPSNHLDWQTKQLVAQILKEYRGIGLIVSHDRELLDTLSERTLFIEQQKVCVHHCNYSQAMVEIKNDRQRENAEYAFQQKEVKKLKKRVAAQRQKADTADKRRSKRGLDKKDHDAKAKIDLARFYGSDGTDGKIHGRLKARLDRAEHQKNKMHFNKEYDLGITFNAQVNKRWFPMSIQPFTIALGTTKKLRVPDLSIEQNQKIGLIGDNGTGKSTFLSELVKNAKIPADSMVYIPQEIDKKQSVKLMQRIHQLDAKQRGFLFSIIQRLGSDPKHLMTTAEPSPGETRKLLLAEGLLCNPALIVMDEPTNHMDLPSIECLESALKTCECSQLLVSHDHLFLDQIVSTYWTFHQLDTVHLEITEQLNRPSTHVREL